MQRKKIKTIILFIGICALLWYEIFVAKGENYYPVSLAILIIGILGFFDHFENGKPNVLLLAMIASLCALAIVGRIAFFFLPQVKPILAIIIISGITFGGDIGFITGAMSAFVSNFYFGQGSWTPFQMFAMGIVGYVAGALFAKTRPSRIMASIYGFFATLILYGGIVDINTVFFTSMEPTREVVYAVYITALPFDIVLAISTAVFIYILYRPIAGKIDRVQNKYRLM